MSAARRRVRAAYGTGTVEQRGDNWFVRHSEGNGDLRRRWREGPFRSHDEAVAHRDIGKRLRGHTATPTDQWLYDWSDRTVMELYQLGRESDADIKERHVRLHLGPRLAGIRVGDLRVGDLNTLWRRLLDSGLSAKSVTMIRGTLGVALADAVADGLLVSNPVRDSRLPRGHRGSTPRNQAPDVADKVLELDQLQRLTDWCVEHETTNTWALPLLLIADTGMRRGEALGVTWEAIDFKTQELTINQQVEQLKSREVVTRPVKTGESNRTIELTTRSIDALLRHRDRTASKKPTGLVFVDRASKPLIPDSLTQYVQKHLVAHLGLPESFSPHALRHTHASVLLAAGTPESVVARRLGHSNPHTTRIIYNRGTKSGDSGAAKRWTELTG